MTLYPFKTGCTPSCVYCGFNAFLIPGCKKQVKRKIKYNALPYINHFKLFFF